jgi:membrane protease YdiL (CAAX protease family)
MEHDAKSHRTARSVGLALLVESGLGVAALVIGWLLGYWPGLGIRGERSAALEQLRAAGWGVVATLPLWGAFFVIERLPLTSLRKVRDIAVQAVSLMFPRPKTWHLAAVSLAAGFGEELLFRGLAQNGLAELIGPPWGTWIALIVASLLFGAFHWLDTTYAILASLAGLYFGLLLIATGNLWTPIVAHALYDFVALWLLLRPNQEVECEV